MWKKRVYCLYFKFKDKKFQIQRQEILREIISRIVDTCLFNCAFHKMMNRLLKESHFHEIVYNIFIHKLTKNWHIE